jgi:23S rRNA pseudouridine1911/1915/1917 synthase
LLGRYGLSIASIGGEHRCGIVHRLDKLTSGALVVARTEPVHAALKEALAARRIQRRYLGIAVGEFKEGEETIDQPIGRRPKERKLMGVVPDGRRAQTSLRVLLGGAGLSLVLIKLHTGRTHQIRVHFQYRGRPILCDPVYGWTKTRTLNALPVELRGRLGPRFPNRQMLHAAGVGLAHPITGEWLVCVAPLPPDMVDVLDLVFGASGSDLEEAVIQDLERIDPGDDDQDQTQELEQMQEQDGEDWE